MSELQGAIFWAFLMVFGALIYWVSPRARDEGKYALLLGTDVYGLGLTGFLLPLAFGERRAVQAEVGA